ncbi:alpha/beta hydrolase [Actinomadura monticuli]|uniref:Alpha/beta hydrolase n=1 Tax=Actinomadura monticuli TaxID=3097367 RepID=A0ABV4Q8T5_9ACTN
MLNDAGRRTAAGTAAAAVALGAAAMAAPAAAALPAARTVLKPPALAWKPCPDKDPVEGARLKGLQCASLRVPLDHARPAGEKITLELTRARHTAAKSRGAVLLNRGGPGAHGRDLPAFFKRSLPAEVAASYDWIGFDPRGVGASRPELICDPSYQDPGRARADTIPANAREERAWTARAGAYARDCGRRYGKVLPHMGTADGARDMEAIRRALGEKKIGYFGYSYGTYLGAVYATMYPGRVRGMVLDSVVKPSGVWYENNLDQNVAFEKRIRAYFAWIARHHRLYGLGDTEKKVAASYARARAALKAKPVDGKIGPSELDDVFLADGYADYSWPAHARALSALAVRHDAGPLRKAWQPPTRLDLNNYTVYGAVQCRDAAWPRGWARWHADSERLFRTGYRFETWSNTWYNAPCAFWPAQGGPPPRVRGAASLPPILLVQGTEDAATPYPGALEMHRRFPTSRLLVQTGGHNHGVALSGDTCVDGKVAAYLAGGGLPPNRPGADATCKAGPPPQPAAGKRHDRAERAAARR